MRSFALGLMAAIMATRLWAGAWDQTLDAARGQTVYWNAWGGDERTNAFIAWVDHEVSEHYGVHVVQVKLADTAEAVTRVLSEKAAGQDKDGSVDLIWINGGNFLSMKAQGLLFGPFLQDLPNARYLDLSANSANLTDFTVPTEGYEAPWRLARFVMTYDTTRVDAPPQSMRALAAWAGEHPGRLAHPAVSNFMGATFLKQALVELAPDRAALAAPVTDATFVAATAPLWAWYDGLRPNLWRGGTAFPENESVLQQMFGDDEVDFAMAFDPAAAANAVETGLLPSTTRSYAFSGGTLGNVSFVAIPFNAAHREGAMVVANFLLDPETQAHAQDIRVLGSYAVLDHGKLDAGQAAAFAALPGSDTLPTPASLGATLPEPHPSWTDRLVKEWARRYTN